MAIFCVVLQSEKKEEDQNTVKDRDFGTKLLQFSNCCYKNPGLVPLDLAFHIPA